MTPMPIARWDLTLDRNAADRIALATPPSYETIVELVLLHMEPLCCHWQRCDEHGAFERTVFCVRVSKAAFDWFFNSKKGYRAAYYVSEWEGERANRFFVESVAADLIASDEARDKNPDRIRESLLSPTAKVWLAEAERGPYSNACPSCREGWSSRDAAAQPEMRNDRWENVPSTTGWGSRAPYIDRLRITGAFIDDRANVLLPHGKRQRALEINATGWS
jgi:hypothetical protein